MNTHVSTPLVFSDLDGSLLDHYSYSFQAALPIVSALERLHIPLIFASSKTRSEILALREALDNEHPFIVENGAAVCVPRDYFLVQPAQTVALGEYWVHEMAPSRNHWLELLANLQTEFPSGFDFFYNTGVAGVMEMTGLSEAQAINANTRDYSEPVKWLGDPQGEIEFIKRLRSEGASVLRGGRFLSVSGNCDKGRALTWLRNCYQKATPTRLVEDLAIGDSNNDCLMLEAAHTALLIRSPVHDFPLLKRSKGVIYSQKFGSKGWAEGVEQWLHANILLT